MLLDGVERVRRASVMGESLPNKTYKHDISTLIKDGIYVC